MSQNNCSQCGTPYQIVNLYGYTFCSDCKSKLGLFTDETVSKHIQRFDQSKPHSYEEEVQRRLQAIEKDFVKAKVKLLHILERISEQS